MNLKTANIVMLILLLASMSFGLSPVITQASFNRTIFSVQPSSIINLTLEPGNSFLVNLYIYEAVDIYAWQIYMEWDPVVLRATDIVFGGFLADQPEGSQTFSWIEPGHLLATESTLGGYRGKYARVAWLCTITFTIKTSGETVLDISGGEKGLTYYVSSVDLPKPVPRYPVTENGFFLNRLPWWLLLLISVMRLFGLIP